MKDKCKWLYKNTEKIFKSFFCLIVLTLLIIPIICISKDNVSILENRNLSKFPSLHIDNRINRKFGPEFNEWLSDRFGGRQMLINLKLFILYSINNKVANNETFMGDNGWLFPTNGIKNTTSTEIQYKKNMEVANLIKKINNSLIKKNVQIYIVFDPNRNELYKKYWIRYYRYYPYINYISDLKKELKEYPNIHLIDLKDTFEKNKDITLLYGKDDTHMTLPAINLMIEKIISELDEDLLTHYKKSITYKDKKCTTFVSHLYARSLNIKFEESNDMCKEINITHSNMKFLHNEGGLRETIVEKPYINKDLYILFPCYEKFVFPVLGEFFAHTISVNYHTHQKHDANTLRKIALSKLKSVKPGTIILIFLSHPTEYTISESLNYLKAF